MKHNDHPIDTSDSADAKPTSEPAHEEVAKKAYALDAKEGHPQGHAKQNGLAAEVDMSGHNSDDHKGHGDHAQMATNFRNRFWISLVLTLPILGFGRLARRDPISRRHLRSVRILLRRLLVWRLALPQRDV